MLSEQNNLENSFEFFLFSKEGSGCEDAFMKRHQVPGSLYLLNILLNRFLKQSKKTMTLTKQNVINYSFQCGPVWVYVPARGN